MRSTGKKFLSVALWLLVLGGIALGLVWYLKPEAIKKWSDAAKASYTKETPAVKVDDFRLLDHQGRSYQLHRQRTNKVVVLISTANGCPTIKEAAPKIKALREKFASQGVLFLMINGNRQDDRDSIAKEAKELGLDVPILKDTVQLVTSALGIEKTAEAICIKPADWTIVYRGAIEESSKNYLEDALTRFLAGKKVSPAQTVAQGTPIDFAAAKELAAKPISYVDDVAPILQKSCVACHSPGNIGPFAMSSYEKVKGWSSMIEEVLLTQRMPPWHADPHYGAFANERALSPEHAHTLAQWIKQGAPRGEGEDPLVAKPAPIAEPWPLGQPDYVVKFPKAEEIPANGVFNYRHITVRSPISSNAWLRAAVIKPGNRKVVHHVLVTVMSQTELRAQAAGQRRSGGGVQGYFAAYVPGYDAVAYPEGTGKLLPAGSMIVFQMHYTETGKPETDLTEMGLYLCKQKPAVELKTKSAYNLAFNIPPGVPEHESVAEYKFTKDALLYELSPHMHLRGSWFKYEAVYPDGKSEVLLSVPNYDFKWQHLYRLAKPKRMPAGTRLVCKGAHDNSPQNPDNPDATKAVTFGEQTFDEMFIGYINYADAPPSRGVVKSAGGG